MMKHISVSLLVSLALGGSILLSQSHFPPSQRELNGFLLGEDAKPLSAGFDTLLKEQKYNDGWTDRVYPLDSAGSAFMVFGFADSSDDCVSIQITGKSGTEMHPFMGLRLGDTRQKVMEILGKPSQIRHLQARGMEYFQYSNRNYSVQLDSMGNLWSIRILGYEGFPEVPQDSLPDLETVFQTIRSSDPELILEVLAPDVEIISKDSVYSFEGSALDVIENQTSRISQLLYSGSSSLSSLDESFIGGARLDPQSVKDNKLTPLYKFPEASPVNDIVFAIHAGKWRIWEVRFSH